MIQLKNENYLQPAEAAQRIGKSKRTVYQFWKTKYNWTPYRFGTSLLFKESDIDKWLETQIEQGMPFNILRSNKRAVESQG